GPSQARVIETRGLSYTKSRTSVKDSPGMERPRFVAAISIQISIYNRKGAKKYSKNSSTGHGSLRGLMAGGIEGEARLGRGSEFGQRPAHLPGAFPSGKAAGERAGLTWFRDGCDAPGSAGRTFAVPGGPDHCACSCCWYNCAPCTRCRRA